ncbi:GGDEF domain-containing protein [Litchfieldella xinjiangensis]|uniref:GGDEF domain-containing protein n=1 Tax=Litchfieldella xinjiangensis TaxID=1166948 RepID=UPI000694B563|nr:GGDEF domain-containing protein [Halomonas xinjiangensis]
MANDHSPSIPVVTKHPIPNSVASRLLSCPTLPSLPTTVMQVVALAREPETSLHDLARSLERDPALTMRLLSLANCVFNAHHKPAEHCLEAVTRLGIDATLSVALGFGLVHGQERRKTRLDLDRVWQRALVGALVGHRLAETLRCLETGNLFTIALVQDIGMLAIDAIEPTLYADLPLDALNHTEIAWHEQQRLGCDHAQVGAWLAGQWGLPSRLVKGIANSHRPLETLDIRERCIVATGLIADAWLAPHPPHAFVDLVPILLEYFSLETKDVQALLVSLQDELPPLARLFEITQPPAFNATHLLLEAKQLLHAHNMKLSETLLMQQEELQQLQREQIALDSRIRCDALTGLFNRGHLEVLLETAFRDAMQQGTTLAVAFIDLDHFKQLNDQYGHRLGDEVLQHFGTLLRTLLTPEVIGGRYGGEEFLLILPGGSCAEAETVARRLLDMLAETPLVQVDGEPLYVSASIGIAQMQGAAFREARELIHAADQGMYAAKRDGRARISVCHGLATK